VDTRTLTLTIALGTTACAGTVYPPVLEESPPTATLPTTPEALAQNAMDRIAADCEDHLGCATYVEDDIYPNIVLPSAERYFAPTRAEEVPPVGFELRFAPGGDTLAFVRGNTLTGEYGLNPNPP